MQILSRNNRLEYLSKKTSIQVSIFFDLVSVIYPILYLYKLFRKFLKVLEKKNRMRDEMSEFLKSRGRLLTLKLIENIQSKKVVSTKIVIFLCKGMSL